jgi:hypothetical protein
MVESTRSSSSEDLTFLCTTACHSLLLLRSSLGLEEGEVGSGIMLLCSITSRNLIFVAYQL